jgi:hypothetical protein
MKQSEFIEVVNKHNVTPELAIEILQKIDDPMSVSKNDFDVILTNEA